MQTITINAYTKLYKLQKSEYIVDIATCKEPKETLSSFYNRQTNKPDILINGGLFVMSNGKPIANFMDEKVKLAINSNYLYGMGVTSKGEMMTGSVNSAYFKDFVSGYPILVSNGKAENITFAKEIDGKHPRTAIGHNSTHYFILIVDGRTSTNKGATFSEMQKWLIKYGVTFAVNLDGGGSTRCLIGGKVANQPTENRAVDNVICFYEKENTGANNSSSGVKILKVKCTKKTSTYTEDGAQESGRYVAAGDICTIENIITDNLLIKIAYPVSSGTRYAYIKDLGNFR